MVTDTAKQKIKHHLSKRGKGVGIRIGVETTGCNGYAYKLEFADTVNEEDTVNKYEDFSVLMDPKAKALLESRCGCGKTFSI
jgi:iron-sulfur cluster assembly protein